MSQSAEYMRQYRETTTGEKTVRAASRARTRAVKWLIQNRPDVWQRISDECRAEEGLSIKTYPSIPHSERCPNRGGA